jgi:hypothetical protein
MLVDNDVFISRLAGFYALAREGKGTSVTVTMKRVAAVDAKTPTHPRAVAANAANRGKIDLHLHMI